MTILMSYIRLTSSPRLPRPVGAGEGTRRCDTIFVKSRTKRLRRVICLVCAREEGIYLRPVNGVRFELLHAGLGAKGACCARRSQGKHFSVRGASPNFAGKSGPYRGSRSGAVAQRRSEETQTSRGQRTAPEREFKRGANVTDRVWTTEEMLSRIGG